MDNRTRALVVVATTLLASPVAAEAEPSSKNVIHAQGTARLNGADPARATSLELEYWGAAPRFRLRCRADGALPQRLDLELAFDGARYQLLERRDDETRLFVAAGSGQAGVVLEAEGSQTRYRLSFTAGPERLPLRIERLAGGAVGATLELLYSEKEADAGTTRLPRAVGLAFAAEGGPALAARGRLALQAPRTEAAAADTFTLGVPQRGGR